MVTPPPHVYSSTNLDANDVESAVIGITSVTSEKYVAAPNEETVLGDLLIGLKRFRNAVRWKAFFQEREEGTRTNEEEVRENPEEPKPAKTCRVRDLNKGLCTNLKPQNRSKMAPIASDNVESFIKEVERTLLTQAISFFKMKDLDDKSKDFRRYKKKSEKDSQIYKMQLELRKSTKVVVPTDKTGSFQTTEITEYI